MRWRIALAVCLSAPLALSRPARAQLAATLDAGFGSVHYDNYLPSTVLTLAPAVSAQTTFASFQSSGTISRYQSGHWSSQGSVAASLFTPAFHLLRAELGGYANANLLHAIGRGGEALALVRAQLTDAAATRGLWAGGGLGRAWADTGRRTLIRTSAGAWWQIDSMSLTSTVSHVGFQPTMFGTFAFTRPSFTDAATTVRYHRSFAEVEGGYGRRFGGAMGDGTTWHLTGTVWAWSQVGVVLSGGRYPTDLLQDLPGGRFATLSIRLRSRPTGSSIADLSVPYVESFRVDGGSAERRTVRVRAPRARRVEIMGDFTDWSPVALQPASGGDWEIALPIAPGVHRINIRVDGGAWVVPPGLAAVTDDFNGVAGLLVVSD